MITAIDKYRNLNFLRSKFLGDYNGEDIKSPLITIEFQDDKSRFIKYFTSYYSTMKYITEHPSYTYVIKDGEEHMENHKEHNNHEIGGEG